MVAGNSVRAMLMELWKRLANFQAHPGVKGRNRLFLWIWISYRLLKFAGVGRSGQTDLRYRNTSGFSLVGHRESWIPLIRPTPARNDCPWCLRVHEDRHGGRLNAESDDESLVFRRLLLHKINRFVWIYNLSEMLLLNAEKQFAILYAPLAMGQAQIRTNFSICHRKWFTYDFHLEYSDLRFLEISFGIDLKPIALKSLLCSIFFLKWDENGRKKWTKKSAVMVGKMNREIHGLDRQNDTCLQDARLPKRQN
jgi:hypothetical protein